MENFIQFMNKKKYQLINNIHEARKKKEISPEPSPEPIITPTSTPSTSKYPIPEYQRTSKIYVQPGLTYVPLGTRLAKEAEESFKKGEIGIGEFLKTQQPGFKATINGEEYIVSMDGSFVKRRYPISGFKGSAIGQKELYSPRTVVKYTKYLKKNPNKDTDGLEVSGTPDNYVVRDGHHRMQAYKNAERTEVPVFIAYKGV
jgi:hypothetical protein